MEEYQYSSSGTLTDSTHYYILGGKLIGALTGLTSPSTVMFLTDALGSLLATFSNVAGSASIQGNQVYGPYGNQLYSSQTQMDTTKGYTGQYGDALSGLDYYISRYYDPVVGVFLSADVKQGNAKGMNPYGYVGGNPETYNDPTGQIVWCGVDCGGGGNGNPTPPPPPPPNHGPTCGPDPLLCYGSNSNGSSGSKSGKPNIQPWHEAPICDATCQREEQAQQLARNAAAFFSSLVNTLNLLELILGGESKTLGAIEGIILGAIFSIDFKFNTFIGGILAAIPRLVEVAQDLANGFAAEANHPLGWFTVQNIENDEGNILGAFFSDSIDYMIVGAGASLLGATITAFSDGTLASIGTWLIVDGGSLTATVGLGAIAMGSIAMGYLGRQEYILGPPEPLYHYFR